MKKHAYILLFFVFFYTTASAQQSPARPSIETSIDQMMAFAETNHCFNGVLLVADKGKVVYNKGFGFANYEDKTPITDTTLFNLCSISKQFTAMGIMMLAEAGKLHYDDSLSTYFPNLPYPGITLRMLLHHTSGLPDYMPVIFDHWTDERIATNADDIAFLAEYQPALKFSPGEKFEYCNTGYMLLASVIEKVSGSRYEDFMRERIFKPLKMVHTRVYRQGIYAKITGLAEPYAFDYADGVFVPTAQYPPYQKQVSMLEGSYGDGGIFSCSSDMFKWDQALKTEKLIKKETLREAFENGTLGDGSPIAPIGYGFGWFLPNDPVNGKIVQHTGGWPGFRQAFIRYLDKDRTILVLRNNEIGFVSIQRAVENILDGKAWEMPKTSLAFVLAYAAREESADLRATFEVMKDKTTPNEMELNDVGYNMMKRGRLKQALEIMKINVELFPASSNAYDSLAELYLKNGEKDLSELNYKKAAELLKN